MCRKTKIVLLLLFSLFSLAVIARAEVCEISIAVQNEKAHYTINDTITVLVKVQLDKEFCDEAGDATKIFGKGLKIIERSKWKKLSETTLGQKLHLTVLKKDDERILTVYRKTAHYNCFQQKEFKSGEEE